MGYSIDVPHTASPQERAQALRRRAIELLDIAQGLRNPDARLILMQTAQDYHRSADALERTARTGH